MRERKSQANEEEEQEEEEEFWSDAGDGGDNEPEDSEEDGEEEPQEDEHEDEVVPVEQEEVSGQCEHQTHRQCFQKIEGRGAGMTHKREGPISTSEILSGAPGYFLQSRVVLHSR